MAYIPDGMIVVIKAGKVEINDGKLELPISYEDKELVMCKHCIHWVGDDEEDENACEMDAIYRPAEWYCPKGEREKGAIT